MKILHVANALPWPLGDSGGAQRIGHMRDALQRCGEVDTLIAADPKYLALPHVQERIADNPDARLRIMEVEYARTASLWRALAKLLPGRFNRLFAELGRIKADYTEDAQYAEQFRRIVAEGQYDAIVVHYLRCATRVGAAFLRDTPVLLDFDDIDWQKHRSVQEQPGQQVFWKRARHAFTGWYVESNARPLLSRFDYVWVTSDRDRGELPDVARGILPNVPVLPENRTHSPSPSNDTILFVGTLGYGPNGMGLNHFFENVWPAILAKHPHVRLRVVGRLPDIPHWVDAWKRIPNVELCGFVDDLDAMYAESLFTIAPIYWGGGTKIKVLESLGRGRTCVVTPQGLYGLADKVRHDKCVWRAESDDAFVRGCCALIEDADLRHRLEARAVEVIRKHYSVSRFQQSVAEALQSFGATETAPANAIPAEPVRPGA